MLDIEFDLSDVLRACTEGQAQRIRSAQDAATTAAREGQARAIARRRYKDRTGGLTGRAFVRVQANQDGGDAEMVWPVPYASHVDAGTSPHVIRAKGNGRLRFEGAGGPVFARKVNHPGTRPYAFAGEAATLAQQIVQREVEVGFAELERILSR